MKVQLLKNVFISFILATEDVASLLSDGYSSSKLLDQEQAKVFMNQIYPKFKKQYQWFKDTQWGEIWAYDSDPDALGFRWRGKKGSHILPSGEF